MQIISEAKLYLPIAEFLKRERSTDPRLTGIASHKDNEEENTQIYLDLFEGKIIPDIYGIDNLDRIYLVEAKLIGIDTHAIDEAIVEAVSYQRFSHYVYVALNFDQNLSHLNYIKQTCKKFGIGILN